MITASAQVRVMDFGLARQAPNRKNASSVAAPPSLPEVDTNATVLVAHQRACDLGERLDAIARQTPLQPMGRNPGSFEAG